MDGQQALTEVSRWDLEDIDTFNAIVSARADSKAALDEYSEKAGDK